MSGGLTPWAGTATRKILLFIHHLSPGGAQRQILELGLTLQDLGHQVQVLCLEKSGDPDLSVDNRLRDEYPRVPVAYAGDQSLTYRTLLGLVALKRPAEKLDFRPAWGGVSRVISMAFALFLPNSFTSRLWGDIQLRRAIFEATRFPTVLIHVFSLSRFLKRQPHDLLIGFLTKGNCVAAMAGKLMGISTVLSERNALIGGKSDRLRPLMVAAYPLATMVTANARFIVGELEGLLPATPVRWLPNSDSYRVPSKHEKSGQPSACVIARLEPQKRIPEVIRAIRLLADRGTEISLDIYGSGSEGLFIEEFIAAEGIGSLVSLKGFVPVSQIPIGSYHFFIANSDYEGSSNSLHEAISQGALPIVSDSIAEITHVLPPKARRIVVNDQSAGGIAKALELLTANHDLFIEMMGEIFAFHEEYSKGAKSHRVSVIREILSV